MLTPDLNNDGIVDTPYTINGNNIDYYPIAIGQIASTQPSATQTPEPPQAHDMEIINTSDTSEISIQESADNQSNIQEEEQQNIPLQTPESEIENDDLNKNGGFADLVISNLNATDSICSGSDLPISCTIENNGDLDARYFSVHYYLSDDLVISPSDNELGYHMIEYLNPHEKQELADTLQISYNFV